MNVLVFGASGATGREVVKQTLDHGYGVRAFVRDPDKLQIKHARLALTIGDVTDYTSVEDAVRGTDAVASALGAGNSLNSHPALINAVHNIVRSMEHAGVRRLVYLSMLGVGGSSKQLGLVDRWIVLPLLLRNVMSDHAKKEELVKQSTLDWVIVRPPRLTNGPYTGGYRSGEHVKENALLASVSRADVADFMVKQLTSNQYVHGTPAVVG